LGDHELGDHELGDHELGDRAALAFPPRISVKSWLQPPFHRRVGGAKRVSPAPQPLSVNGPGETVEGIQQAVAALEASDLDEESKSRAEEFYQAAQNELEQSAQQEARVQELQGRAERVPERLEEFQELARQREQVGIPAAPPTATVAELERLLGERQSELEQVTQRLEELASEPERRAARRLEIPKDLATLREQLQSLDNQLAAPPEAGVPLAVTNARRTMLRSRRQNRQAQIAALEAELAAYDAESELLQQERTFQVGRRTALNAEVTALTNQANELRQNVVLQRHNRIVSQAARIHPALTEQGKANVARSQEVLELTARVSELLSELDALRNEQAKWSEDIGRMQRRVQRGASETMVALLSSTRDKLPGVIAQHRRQVVKRQSELMEVQRKSIEVQEASDDFHDIATEIAALRDALFVEGSPDEELAITRDIETVVRMKRELIDDQLTQTNQYFLTIIDLNFSEESLVKDLEQYLSFIDERIFWIPNADPLSLKNFQALATISIDWKGIGNAVWQVILLDLRENLFLAVPFWLLMIGLLVSQRWLRRTIADQGALASRGSCLEYRPTLITIFLTVLLTVPWGLLILYLSWRFQVLSLIVRESEAMLPLALGVGLLSAARIYLPLEFLRQICRRKGLAEAHFGWSEKMLRATRFHLRWFLMVSVPLTFVAATGNAMESTSGLASLARLCHILEMLFVAVLAHLVFRPQRGVFSEFFALHANGWIYRLRYVWYTTLVVIPVILALMGASGYYYTSWQLTLRLHRTVVAAVILCIAQALLFRGLLLNRRRLAIRLAKKRQQQMQNTATLPEGAPAAMGAIPSPTIDLAAINTQTRRFISSMLLVSWLVFTWFTWIDVLPAIGFVGDYQLYRVEAVGLEPGMLQWITLSRFLRGILVLLVTIIAARNIPGLVEIFILQHLPLDSSVRYATSTISSYLIMVAGIVITSSLLGFSWQKAQWLVAALSVGLGFGLQEIFANFVSGVILLFERPIRVGDVITLGDVTGQVTRIRIRATTLTDWDRKELIVPNKDLITGRLLNWTLTDTSNRITLDVGVSYDADVVRARELLLEIAQNHPSVNKDPAPSVTFERLGASSLDLVIRCVLSRLDQRLACINDLHTEIIERFRQEGIEIAYPQMDLHVRDTVPIPFARNGGGERIRVTADAPETIARN
jgi:potassium-dependent mechanosensitive channel